MISEHSSIKKLPDTSGVYFFLGAKREVLYVGKATSLKSRVSSYFSSKLSKTRGPQIVRMVELAKRVDYRTTDSVLEALILEAKLIKEFKPTYNTRDKDDKSFNHLVITVGEEYPRLLTVRGKDLAHTLHDLKKTNKKQPLVYGPFPHAHQFKEALKIIRKIFPYYDTKHSVAELKEKQDKKILFNESIGVYPHKGTTVSEYKRTIRYIKALFDGKISSLQKTLERDMKKFAKAEKFEKANTTKKQLFSLQHIEDISLIKKEREHSRGAYRIEAYDVAHLQGSNTVGVMVVVEKGLPQKSEYRKFIIRDAVSGSDTGALKEMLERRLAHPEWMYPRLIVVDGGKAQINVAKKVLESAFVDIPIVAVTKDKKHRPNKLQGPIKIRNAYQSDILLANSEAHRFALTFHKKKQRQSFA